MWNRWEIVSGAFSPSKMANAAGLREVFPNTRRISEKWSKMKQKSRKVIRADLPRRGAEYLQNSWKTFIRISVGNEESFDLETFLRQESSSATITSTFLRKRDSSKPLRWVIRRDDHWTKGNYWWRKVWKVILSYFLFFFLLPGIHNAVREVLWFVIASMIASELFWEVFISTPKKKVRNEKKKTCTVSFHLFTEYV